MTDIQGEDGALLRSGTSGFSYAAWKGPFYPEGLPARRRLEYYASKLPAVEINNTFYRMPNPDMLRGWAQQVPADFRFVLKAPRRITHRERLRDSADSVGYFVECATVLGERLGALFFQLPPSLRCDLDLLASFLESVPEGPRLAFEFRHASWRAAEVDALLRERGVARVVVDTGDGDGDPLITTAPFTMVRLRAPHYSDAALRVWIEALRAAHVGEAFVFFKHEDEGVAPRLAGRALELWGAR